MGSGIVCANTVCDTPAVIRPTRANVARIRAVVVVFGVIGCVNTHNLSIIRDS